MLFTPSIVEVKSDHTSIIYSSLDNDEKWRGILRKMNKVFYHQTVTTVEIETFLAEESGLNLQAFFDQYAFFVEMVFQ